MSYSPAEYIPFAPNDYKHYKPSISESSQQTIAQDILWRCLQLPSLLPQSAFPGLHATGREQGIKKGRVFNRRRYVKIAFIIAQKEIM